LATTDHVIIESVEARRSCRMSEIGITAQG
jgi:hypothetical protein